MTAARAERPGAVRRSARVLCLDETDAVLLFLHEWSGRGAPARWLTVGGGIEPGETELEAALRELREETGLVVDASALVGPVRHGRHPTPPRHDFDALDMTTFLLRTPRFATDEAQREADERRDMLDERWWRESEITASTEPFDAEDVAGTLALLRGELPEPGDLVRVRSTKWDGTPHWQYDAVALGRDDEGVWLGVDGPTTRFARPGLSGFIGETRKVMLVPHRPIAMTDGQWALVHWFEGGDTRLYVDICTPPELIRRRHGWELRYCDLDLDVVQTFAGSGDVASPWIDDEDEFALHRDRMAYPAWVVDRARETADRLLKDARRDAAPGRDGFERWLAAPELTAWARRQEPSSRGDAAR